MKDKIVTVGSILNTKASKKLQQEVEQELAMAKPEQEKSIAQLKEEQHDGNNRSTDDNHN